MTSEHVVVTDADGIRTIRMNRPDKKNALTLAMYETMTAALEGANADDSVRCVLIAGVPGAFSAGNDLVDFLQAAESRDGLNRPALRFLPALVRCNKPMVAAVSGVAVGLGTTMLFHCDFVVAGSDGVSHATSESRRHAAQSRGPSVGRRRSITAPGLARSARRNART